jgi:hypothetical protein
MGFIAVLGSMALYFTGLLFAIIFDIQPQKRLKYKLYRDFRSMDKYLFKDEDLDDSKKDDGDKLPLACERNTEETLIALKAKNIT